MRTRVDARVEAPPQAAPVPESHGNGAEGISPRPVAVTPPTFLCQSSMCCLRTYVKTVYELM